MSYLGYVAQEDFQKLQKEFDGFFKKPESDKLNKMPENWHKYWSQNMLHQYVSYYSRNISKNPKLFLSLLSEVASFNFIGIQKYMKSVNWTWGSDNHDPSIEDMIECVFGLAMNVVENENEECVKQWKKDNPGKPYYCSSGGFIVERMDDKFKLKFEKSS